MLTRLTAESFEKTAQREWLGVLRLDGGGEGWANRFVGYTICNFNNKISISLSACEDTVLCM